MKKLLVLVLCVIMMLSMGGCSVDYVAEHEITEVSIHTSIVSSKRYIWSEKDEINSFFNEFKILDTNFIHTAAVDFDAYKELYINNDAIEIRVESNNNNEILFYVTRDGVVYRKSADGTVYTDSSAINYDEMIRFLDSIK